MQDAILQIAEHEHTQILDLSGVLVDPIPPNWVVTALGDVTNILFGQSPPGETYNVEGIGKLLINGPAEYGVICPVPVQWTTRPEKMCAAGDILFCVRGNTIGRINIADQVYCRGLRGKLYGVMLSFSGMVKSVGESIKLTSKILKLKRIYKK